MVGRNTAAGKARRFAVAGSALCARIGLIAALSSLWLLTITVVVQAEDAVPDPVIARVDGAEVHESDLALAEQDLGPNFKPKNVSEKRRLLLTYATDMILAEKLAEARGIAAGAEFQRRYALMRRKLAMEMLLEGAVRDAQTDAALHAAYDQLAGALKADPEFRTRHILFKTNASDPKSDETAHDGATTAVHRLRSGEDFAAVEKAAAPAGEGGESGFGALVSADYSRAAHGLRIGEVSDPVKTEIGWYAIKLEELRDRPIPSFESVKEQIASSIARNARLEFLNQMRANAHIEEDHEAAKP